MSSDNFFLQEMPSTIAYFDMRRFSVMASQLGPVDVGVALRRYYEHIEEAVLAHQGRLVKFMSDGVLALFPSISARDHAGNGLAAVARLSGKVEGWLAENERLKLPVMEYSVGLDSGNVLFGEIGTARQKSFDVLGLPVTLAIRLARLATERGTPHLLAASSIQAAAKAPASIEVEAAELAGQRMRLYRLLSQAEQEAADEAGAPAAGEKGEG